MKKIHCEKCGHINVVSGLGRKRLNTPPNGGVTNICDAIREGISIRSLAKKLGVSRGWIYKRLKEVGLTPKEVINGHSN